MIFYNTVKNGLFQSQLRVVTVMKKSWHFCHFKILGKLWMEYGLTCVIPPPPKKKNVVMDNFVATLQLHVFFLSKYLLPNSPLFGTFITSVLFVMSVLHVDYSSVRGNARENQRGQAFSRYIVFHSLSIWSVFMSFFNVWGIVRGVWFTQTLPLQLNI